MTIYGVTSSGKEYKLNNLLTMNINIEEKVPADDLTVTFASQFDDEFIFIKVLIDDKLFFLGVVDEQVVVYLEKYIYTKFLVRSMAALLLDNEALPQVYINPDETTIFNRHIKCLGIEKFCTNNKLNAGVVEISKGQSQWNVLYNFCRACLNSYPEVATYGEVLMNGYKSDKTLKLGNKNNIPINYVHICKKQHKLISEVFVKNNYNDDYTYKLKNNIAIDKGVIRQRYLNATDTTSYSVNTAIKMIEKSNADIFNIVVKSPTFLADTIGRNVILDINGDIYKDMYVSKITYNYNQGKESTILVLKYKS